MNLSLRQEAQVSGEAGDHTSSLPLASIALATASSVASSGSSTAAGTLLQDFFSLVVHGVCVDRSRTGFGERRTRDRPTRKREPPPTSHTEEKSKKRWLIAAGGGLLALTVVLTGVHTTGLAQEEASPATEEGLNEEEDFNIRDAYLEALADE